MNQGQVESPNMHGAIYNSSQPLHLKQKINSKKIFSDQVNAYPFQTQRNSDTAEYEIKITILEKKIWEYQLELLEQKKRLNHL
jgi:hypothetical protein